MKTILIIGGDDRLLVTEKQLIRQGFRVGTLGLKAEEHGSFAESDVYLLPVPSTRDGKHVFAPLTGAVIPLAAVTQAAGDRLVLGCNCNLNVANYIDYGSLDGYSLLNAVPTAEGAIKLAIENTDFTLWKSRVLVIGYGRVGKILADRLRALGCSVTVSARKSGDLCLADALHYDYVRTEDLNRTPLDYDIVFNTVDHLVLDEQTLRESRISLMIELASKNGFDMETAKACGIKAIKAPGLPGKVAPVTAGKILSQTVTEILSRHYPANH